jgi:hypothetical protein
MDPYLPLDELKPVAEDVWIVDGPEIRFGAGPLKFPFPTRMTVVRLPDNVLWLHSPTRRHRRWWILADLIENFEAWRIHNPLHRLIARLGGVLDPDGKTPADLQFALGRRRPELRAALRRMIDWAPERVILAHGRWYDRDGAGELERAFRWAL